VSATDIPAAVAQLDELTRRLRRECPWDREQDERTIVPHTVEEAYELADAAHAGDDAKLLDELGDVLFQVVFLSLLLEERGAGDLAAVAEHCRQKLIRRHPHVFGEEAGRSPAVQGRRDAAPSDQDAGPEAPRRRPETAAAVLRNWDAIKRDEPGREEGVFAEVPENLPALLLARKVQRRAASAGVMEIGSGEALQDLRACVEALANAPDDPEARFGMLGAVLFAAVHVARAQRIDPELALRAAAGRFREAVESPG
jgi:ATP diphosphatase